MAGYVCRRRMLVSRRQWHRRPRVQEDLRPVWGRNSDGTSDRTAKATTVSQPAILTVFSGVRHLHARVKSSASRAAASAPPAPYNPAWKLAWRSGVKSCAASSNTEAAMRADPTTSGLGQTRQAIDLTTK